MSAAVAKKTASKIKPRTLADAVAIFERLEISDRLRCLSGNITQTAIELGIDRRTLQRKMRSLGIEA